MRGYLFVFLLAILSSSCGGGSGGNGGGGNPPATPTGVTATPGNGQISLQWNASNGASSYKVSRTTTSGGPAEGPYAQGHPVVTFTETAQ